MSYNLNSNSSSESANKMEINRSGSNNNITNSNQEEQIELQTTNTNSNNNMSIDGGTTPSSSSSKLANTSPNTSTSTKTSSSSPMCTNSNKSSSSASSSDENTQKNSSKSNNTDSGATHRRLNNLYSSNEDYDDAEEQEEEENNRYQSSDGSGSGGSGSSQPGGSSTRATINTDQELSTAHSTSAYERLTKSVRSFLNATQILRSHFMSDSPESSAAEESSSLNNQASLSPYSNNSSSSSSEASPPSSSSPSQSGLSPPSLSSSNQSSSCSSSNHHRHHHYHHHHHAHSSSNSEKFKNMPKKSNLFDELLKQCGEISVTNNNNANSLNNNSNDNNNNNNNLNQNNTNPFSVKANDKAKPSQQKVNKFNLKSLLNILKNYENYSTTMYFPITDNYKLESAKIRIPFRKSVGRNSRRNSTKKSSGIIKSNGEDSNELGEVELAFKKQEHQQEQQRASKKSEEIKNENKKNEINNNRNENSAGSNSASTSISNSNRNTPSSSSGGDTSPTKLKSSEFIICPLCCHCMYEPITLICGCSFCKSCLNEFNLTSIKLSLIKLAKQNAADNLNELDLFTSSNIEMNGKSLPNSNEISSSHGKTCQSDDENSSVGSSSDDNNHNTNNSNNPNSNSRSSNTSNSNSEFRDLSCKTLGLFKCFNCSKVHECNSSEYLKTNTNIASIVDKLFQSKIEIRKLRNDIRRYIVINLENNNNSSNQTRHFDLNKYEKMLTYAYKLDTTNHLLLADLFMLNYFCGRLDKALEYAKKTTEIRPKWSFSYFMKSICYQKIGDLGNLRANLIQCFQLDPSIEQIRYKIFQINYILLKPNHSQITDGKSALAYLKNKDIYSLKKSENPSFDLSAIKRSYSFHNNPDPNQMNDSSKYPRAISIDVQPKKRNSNDSESKSVNSNKDNINYRFKSIESLNTDENDQNDSNDDFKQININVNLINVNDFECSLCYRLFYNPVTTPCGHSYCSSCLERSLDYQDKCPLCKNSLADVYLAERRHSPTVFLDSLIKSCFSKEYEIRKKQYLDELKELTNNENEIPVFVCTAALPFASCPLHIYEPRYRLMLRRAIETGSKQFGMCMYSEITPYHYTEYGCMLEIRNYQFTRDGRAVVATVGGRRFKVIRAYMKDGYNVAQIEWVTDVREEDPESINELQSLHDKTYQLALKWYRLIPELQKQKILEIYGEIPLPESDIQANDNGPVWHWFLLNILPLENDFQYKFLTKTSLKERLKQIKKLLIFMLLIDRSRQQMTTSTSTQNIYEGDAEVSNLTSRSRSSNQIDNDQQDQN